MIYGSVCSGIEAASMAWKPLGWKPTFVSEIAAFPRAVLHERHPEAPNFGDMLKFKEWPDAKISLLVGGTPCQSFSIAGLRKGLNDPRGNLMLTYLAIAHVYRPEWLVWENVPGVLSSDGGRDFGCLLGGMAKLGYGFAFRILDAQYFGVPQRRRRVFVVANSRDWRRAAAVLFEPESMRGDPPPRREAGETITGTLEARTTGGGGVSADHAAAGGLIHCPDIVPQAMSSKWSKGSSGPSGDEVANLIAFSCKDSGLDAGDLSPTLRAMAHDGSHSNGGGQVAIAIRTANTNANGHGISEEVAHTLDGANGQAVAFSGRNRGAEPKVNRLERPPHHMEEMTGALDSTKPWNVATGTQVRRLTPRECERLQGFPDDYTLIKRGGKMAADGPRYKALGNSMAVPVMKWIGERIQLIGGIA